MTIRGVTFDWWGTMAVIPTRNDAAAVRDLRISRLEARLSDLGIRGDRNALLAAYDRQGELIADAWERYQELDPDEQVHAFLRFAGLDAADRGLIAAIGEAFGAAILVRRPDFFPHLQTTLERLTARGLAIGLISNTGRTWGRYLTDLQDAIGIGRYFRFRAYSDELRVRKPDPAIFEAALAGLDMPPDEVVHIGDDVTADVAGAAEIGMRTVWFKTRYWPDARTDRANAEIRDHAELPAVVEALS
ncbi:MAG: HAD family hydrolase [Thermoplasmata archaeon]